ncbi:hypothetical protein QR680_015611 [Steinernema hermaphroditum]|uniref:G-protein coupled receptors family 1 profile domain-containing protein n=1 Tax=Steinernema hermaphroditum TaxID=289476 RepID=A0AA39HAZ3_9BILA|nr:hypothetical protein QR680_015611 [Steinernema hermaphroditum]
MNGAYEERNYNQFYQLDRLLIMVSVFISTPLNLSTMYLILFKSPKRLQTYKYILLNIAIWVFAYEIVQNVIALPMPIIEILGFYAEGLAKALSPEGGFACFVGIVFCIGQYIVALLFAFFYRYRALKIDFGVCGVNPTKWHYRVVIAVLMVVPPGSMAAAALCVYTPHDIFKVRVLNIHPELSVLLDNLPLFGFDSTGFVVSCGIISAWLFLWTVCVTWCIRGIIMQFREHRSAMSEFTYRMHLQLMRSLAVQTAAPVVLFVVPLSLVMVGVITGVGNIDDIIVLTVLMMSLHSTINSLAVVLFIAPYRNAVVDIFRKVFKMSAVSSVQVVSVSIKSQSNCAQPQSHSH